MRAPVGVSFIAYCTLAGSTWLLEPYSSGWPSLLRLCLHASVVCISFLTLAWTMKVPWPRMRWEQIALWGAVLFAGPSVLVAGAAGSVGSLTVTLIFALVPSVTVFTLARTDPDRMRWLLPSLAGVGGLALVMPFAWPSAWFGVTWLLILTCCMIASGIAQLRLHTLLAGTPLVWAAALASAASALLAGAGWAGFQAGPVAWRGQSLASEFAWGLLLDAPLTLLLLLLIRHMQPTAAATRFTLVPVVTILGGIATLRPTVGWTTWLGLALAVGSSAFLIRAEDGDTPGETLRLS